MAIDTTPTREVTIPLRTPAAAHTPTSKPDSARRAMVGIALAAAGVVSMGALSVHTASPAQAHAVVSLNGTAAVAGERSVITMSIPHGCNGTLATNRVKIRFSKDWRAKPKNVSGWDKSKRRGSNGSTLVVWRAGDEPLPAHATGDFGLKVRYPKAAGLYSLPTIQTCGDVKSKWNEPDRGGATANHPYPGNYPAPKVKVRR